MTHPGVGTADRKCSIGYQWAYTLRRRDAKKRIPAKLSHSPLVQRLGHGSKGGQISRKRRIVTEGERQGVPTSAREGASGRLIGAVVSPEATFESIARRPGWLLPVLLLVVVNVAVAFSSIRRGYVSAYIPRELEELTPGLTPDQRQKAIAIHTREAPVGAYAYAIIGTPIGLLIVAAVFFGAFRIGFGAAITFAQSFSVTAYAAVPSIVRGFVALAFLWARPPTGASPLTVSMSNLGAYLPAHVPLWLTTLGIHIDAFTFWTMGLLATGFAAASAKRVPRRTAFVMVIVIWAVYVLANAGLAAGVYSLVRSRS
jgi:hypothetical protein